MTAFCVVQHKTLDHSLVPSPLKFEAANLQGEAAAAAPGPATNSQLQSGAALERFVEAADLTAAGPKPANAAPSAAKTATPCSDASTATATSACNKQPARVVGKLGGPGTVKKLTPPGVPSIPELLAKLVKTDPDVRRLTNE